MAPGTTLLIQLCVVFSVAAASMLAYFLVPASKWKARDDEKARPISTGRN